MIKIGIDPDVDKSGFAVWDSKRKKFAHIFSFDLFDLVGQLMKWNLNEPEVLVYIEAGWLNKKSNFHVYSGQSKRVGEGIAKNVGRNHEVGRQIEKFCIKHDIKYTLIRPVNKKVKDVDLFKRLTKWTKPTNQDKRDAAMLVLGR